MLANQAERLLIFRGRRVFHPEQAVVFNRFTQARRFNRRQAMVDVVQQVRFETEFFTYGSKQLGNKVEVFSVDQDCSSGQPLVAGS